MAFSNRYLFFLMIFFAGLAAASSLYQSAKNKTGEPASANRVRKITIGQSSEGRPIEAWQFEGRGQHQTVVVGGIHGSELSAVELAHKIMERLQVQETQHRVLVIPELFPDNAAKARRFSGSIGSRKNIGRHTRSFLPDPNRQFPTPGKPFLPGAPYDAFGRRIEKENRYLLELLQEKTPDYLLTLHAVRRTGRAGIFADPRADAKGRALGFAGDSTLAVELARYISRYGGTVEGNRLENRPTAIYFNDPAPADAGEFQARKHHLLAMTSRPAEGISLGAWAATAVDPPTGGNRKRKAIPVITVELPGYAPSSHRRGADSLQHVKNLEAYATAIIERLLQHKP